MRDWNLNKLIVINLIVLNIAIIFLAVALIFSPNKTLATSIPETTPKIEQKIEAIESERLSQGRGRKYEYKVEYQFGFPQSNEERDRYIEALNDAGKDGWELTQTDVVFNPSSGRGLYILIFKKDK
ncbi:MAG: DUF4177 domain-containing protein [Okeania sp. SIO3B5]|uniref:DUF4177 domain-containing protein n=1 Tax=Okeania sp. SIO3B5 TaxID=2607811 RepID=UPI0013FEFF37|nr:DUF4177 domain-containing protein [Okeania sp. SIO3B5]NEO54706.1 DUF4177 domain-containing protein [Okeania sp. SIO3B5]